MPAHVEHGGGDGGEEDEGVGQVHRQAQRQQVAANICSPKTKVLFKGTVHENSNFHRRFRIV